MSEGTVNVEDIRYCPRCACVLAAEHWEHEEFWEFTCPGCGAAFTWEVPE